MRKVVEILLVKSLAAFGITVTQVKTDWGPSCDRKKKYGTWLEIDRFALGFPTLLESGNSKKKLETLVWAIELFRNYVQGTIIQKLSNHKAKARVWSVIMISERTLNGKLDDLTNFDISVQINPHPGKNLGFVEWICLEPSLCQCESRKTQQMWKTWFTANHVTESNAFLNKDKIAAANQPQANSKWKHGAAWKHNFYQKGRRSKYESHIAQRQANSTWQVEWHRQFHWRDYFYWLSQLTKLSVWQPTL